MFGLGNRNGQLVQHAPETYWSMKANIWTSEQDVITLHKISNQGEHLKFSVFLLKWTFAPQGSLRVGSLKFAETKGWCFFLLKTSQKHRFIWRVNKAERERSTVHMKAFFLRGIYSKKNRKHKKVSRSLEGLSLTQILNAFTR